MNTNPICPVFGGEEDCGKGSEEDSYLSAPFPPAYVDHLLLDMLPTRQQCCENDECDRCDKEDLGDIGCVIAKGQKQAHFVSDQPCSKTEDYREVAAQPCVAESNSNPASNNNQGQAVPEVMEVDSTLNNHDLRVQGGEKPGAKEARDKSQCSIEGQPMPEDGPLDFLHHIWNMKDSENKG